MIDIHAHVVLEESLGAAGHLGPDLIDADPCTGRQPQFRVGDYTLIGVKYRDSPFMDLDLRIERMDERGIELQVLSPNPLTYFSHVDAATANEFARRHNDAMAELVSRAPQRIAGFAQLPMQDPRLAAAELHRAVGECGLVAAYVGTDYGIALDAPEYDEVYAACEELDVALFIHPTVDGIDAPRRDARLARFDGDLWMGFCYEETLAVTALVLGGVLERHPNLDVCISHGGGATSWLAERMAHAARTRPWAPDSLREAGAVEALLDRLWWDAHVGGPKALAALLAAFGDDHIVSGTNLAGWDETIDPSYGDAELAAALHANTCRLLRRATTTE